MSIRQLSSRVVYGNPWMLVREDEIERDNGQRGIYGVIEKHDSAVVLPMQGDSIYLVEQFRYPIGQRSLELPQGSLDADGFDPAEIARRELQEETGLIAGRLESLGEFAVAIGYSNQKNYAFLATDLLAGARRPDLEEHDLVVHKMRVAEFEQGIRDNLIRDAQTLAAWALYRTRYRAAVARDE